MRARRNPQSRIPMVLAGIVAIAVTAVVLLLAAGDDDSAGPERGETTLSEVLGEPERYLGRQVTVSGEVSRVDARGRAFTIGARVSPQENELLVYPPQGSRVARDLDVGSVVRASGTVVRVTNPPDEGDGGDPLFEDEEDDALDEFEGELSVRARRVEVLARGEG